MFNLLQALYHSVSVVGTLLLQIGEVGQKFEKRKTLNLEEEEGKDVDDVDGAVDTKFEELQVDEKSAKPYDNDWSITFEQFLASILTEPALVDHFSEKVDLTVRYCYLLKCADVAVKDFSGCLERVQLLWHEETPQH